MIVDSHAPISAARRVVVSLLCAVALGQFSFAQNPGGTDEERAILVRNGRRDAFVHDPSSIVKCNGEYWFYATGRGIPSWHSKDLIDWKMGPPVFSNTPEWTTNIVTRQRGNFWAPDVICSGGRYLIYYSVSSFGVNNSAIALASNPTLDPNLPNYHWADEGIVIQSVRSNNFNTIDPAVIRARNEQMWMTFGSFWSGIKLVQLDPSTGKRISSDSPLYSLARNTGSTNNAIEAPYIHQHAEYFYLFVNWDRCCRGVSSTYNIRIGCSKEITGPYVDKDGVDMTKGGGTLFLSTEGPFIGPGHANILEDGTNHWFSCHFYDGTQRGASKLSVRPLHWASDGWPVLDPATRNSPSNP